MTNLIIALPIFFSKQVATRAIKVALIVGTILALINHGDVIFSGNLTLVCIAKMLLTYCVPYTVSSVTATMAKMEALAA